MTGKREYYATFLTAKIGFGIAYAYMILIMYLYFYGINNDDHEDYDKDDRRIHNPPRRLYKGNLHVVLSGFLPFFTASGVMAFRAFYFQSYGGAKLAHAILGIIPLPTTILSFKHVSNWWKYSSNPHTTYRHCTFHDWIGFAYIGLFVLQLIVGFVVYVILPRRKTDTVIFRARFSTYHTSIGLAVFVLSVVVCLTGIVAYAGTIYSDVAAYPVKTKHSKLHVVRQTALQIAAVLYALPAVPVVYLLAKEQFKLFGSHK